MVMPMVVMWVVLMAVPWVNWSVIDSACHWVSPRVKRWDET